MSEIKKIKAFSRDGDFVHENQVMAAEQDFRNVSLSWLDKTTPISEEIENLRRCALSQSSIATRLRRIRPIEITGTFCVEVGGRILRLDEHAAGQLGNLVGIGNQYPKMMNKCEFHGDAEALVTAFEHGLSGAEASKSVILRIDQDGDVEYVRGVFSERTNVIKNEWLLGVINRALPGARFSHRRGDVYTLRGNILIPDSIRVEADSEYGALVSISNCEVLKVPVRLCPSLFRAICMNGCIWGEAAGVEHRIHRRTAHDLSTLEVQIAENIDAQIPIVKRGLEQFLQIRHFKTDVSIKPVLAQIAIERRLSKKIASAVLDAWHVENNITPDLGHSLFGVVNAVTRAGQLLDDRTWQRCDEIGGLLASLSRDDWEAVTKRAARLRRSKVDARFATWSTKA